MEELVARGVVAHGLSNERPSAEETATVSTAFTGVAVSEGFAPEGGWSDVLAAASACAAAKDAYETDVDVTVVALALRPRKEGASDEWASGAFKVNVAGAPVAATAVATSKNSGDTLSVIVDEHAIEGVSVLGSALALTVGVSSLPTGGAPHVDHHAKVVGFRAPEEGGATLVEHQVALPPGTVGLGLSSKALAVLAVRAELSLTPQTPAAHHVVDYSAWDRLEDEDEG